MICIICGIEFDSKNYRKTCSKSCSCKLGALHTNKEEKNKKISNSFKINNSHVSYNKDKHLENGIWKDNLLYKINICKECNKKIMITQKNKRNHFIDIHFCSNECKTKYFSKLAKERQLGGYEPNSIKKHHKGNYHGVHCDSSWELAYLVYCLEHDIPIKRCNIKRNYIFEGKEKTYFPDFIINDNQIIEIKGYFDKGAKEKQKQNPDILILFENDLKEVLEYVSSKYGNKFWETLYE